MVTYRSVHEIYETIERKRQRFKKTNPIGYFLYYYCYLPLYRLWENRIRQIPRETKWFFQRGRRGWSDADTWHFDYYLASVIVGGIEHLSKTIHGYPDGLSEEEWTEILNTIKTGFQMYIWQSDDYESPYVNPSKIQEAKELFIKYFEHFWD